jgi:hypothetical protein
MALGCGLTSVRGDRGENYEKWTAGSPKTYKEKISYGRHIWQPSQGFVNSIYRFPIYTWALSPGLLRRMQLSNAHSLRRVYSAGSCPPLFQGRRWSTPWSSMYWRSPTSTIRHLQKAQCPHQLLPQFPSDHLRTIFSTLAAVSWCKIVCLNK